MRNKVLYIFLGVLFNFSSILAQDMPKWVSDYFEAQNNYDFSKAEEILTNNFDRSNSDCCAIMGSRMLDERKYDYAIAWFNSAISNYKPTNYYTRSTMYLQLSEIFNHLERYDEALDCLIKSKDDNFANGRGGVDDILRIAKQHTKMGQYAKAEDYYYHILRYEENNEDAKIDLAYLYLMYAAKEDSILLDSIALALINEVITLRPSSSQAYYARGQHNQYVKNDLKAAIDDYLSYAYFSPDYDIPDEFYYCAFMEFQYAITRINEWAKYCNTKQKREKNKYFFIRKRAKVYENKAYYREAIGDYSEVLEDDPDGTNKLWALPARGSCYLNIYDYQNAINDYSKCIEISEDFNDYLLYAQRAYAYTELGRYEEASNDWTMVIKNSNYEHYIAFAYYRRGWIKEFLKDDYGAFRDYNCGIEADSTYAYLYLMRGETYMRFNKHDKAKEDFEKVLEMDTIVQDGSCRQYALFFLGDTIGAIDWMRKIIEAEPEAEGHYYDMACLFARMGRLQESVDNLRKSFEFGYRRIAHVKIDDDLDPIRELPEYKALIEKYEAECSTQKIEELLKKERATMSDKEKLDLLREFKLSE